MDSGVTAAGQERSWNLIRKLGEGDAGEVYLVESLLDAREAILKRPRRSAFTSDIIRQATQIETEGKILKAIASVTPAANRTQAGKLASIHTPGLIDRSHVGTEYSERFFIVLERAQGIDLTTLARITRYGQGQLEEIQPRQQAFMDGLTRLGKIPPMIILRALVGLFLLFDEIHAAIPRGIIWNDVKPDHLFWDPHRAKVTIIDWGNARFLEEDGYDAERRLSKTDDYAQLLQSFHGFLSDHAPDLLEKLEWPASIPASFNINLLINPLKERTLKQLELEFTALQAARQAEDSLLSVDLPDVDGLESLFAAQEQIIGFGEIPDYHSSERFCTRLATSLANAGQLDEFARLSSLACHIHADNPEKWKLLSDLVINSSQSPALSQVINPLIQDGLFDNWASALWRILSVMDEMPRPDWLNNLVAQIRQVGLGIKPESSPPLVILKRALLTMQADIQKRRDSIDKIRADGPAYPRVQSELQAKSSEDAIQDSEADINAFEILIKCLKDEVIARWCQPEPDPPDSGIEYSEINRCLEQIGARLPGVQRNLEQALQQPYTLAQSSLEAWNERNFESSRQGLRGMLIWDPDRTRVFLADRAITQTPRWLEAVRQGPSADQIIQDYAANLEIAGRELRNRVGGAEWLDKILYALAHLRRGKRPGEILIEFPELTHDLPWLDILEPRKYVQTQPARPIPMERASAKPNFEPIFFGMLEGGLGVDQDFLLADTLDTWAPEARGSSARAFTGFLRTKNSQLKQVAVKIMRPDRREYALPLFREEVQVLTLMRDVTGVIPMLECGFITLDTDAQLPPDVKPASARSLTGSITRYGPDQTQAFLSTLENQAQLGRLPYIAIPKLDNDDNLMWACDIGFTHGSFLPVEEGLRIAIQICEVLMTAHERNIVYRDHKLLHYYWQEHYNGVFIIDWNVARYHPEGLSRAEIQADLVQLGARCLHHVFTGRVAPGALADGPTRPEEIETAAQSYRAQWTYDDQRLPLDLKNILEELLAGNYQRTANLKEDLFKVYERLIDGREQVEQDELAGE